MENLEWGPPSQSPGFKEEEASSHKVIGLPIQLTIQEIETALDRCRDAFPMVNSWGMVSQDLWRWDEVRIDKNGKPL